MKRTNKINIHQALHGYSEGHRLLASSVDLSKEEERLMLILSDMSGPNMVHGFEEYTSGYPLTQSGMFAFSKTWYAMEMSRPGCVWTHSLLIKKEDVGCIDNINDLSTYFNRPDTQNAWDSYKQILTVDTTESLGADSADDVSERVLARLFKALYDSSPAALFIPAANSKQYETLVFKIWNQMWPNLRGAFSFCTGALSNRKGYQKSFDLQVIPVSLASQLKRDVPQGHLIGIDNEKSVNYIANIENEPWIVSAINDLKYLHNDINSMTLHRFLSVYSDDVKLDRCSFAALAKAYTIINETNAQQITIGKLIESISEIFPSASEACKMKSDLLPSNSPINRPCLVQGLNVFDVIYEYATTAHHVAFVCIKQGFQERVDDLWISDRRALVNLLAKMISANLNPLGEEILLGIAKSVTLDDAVELYNDNINLFFILTKLNPSLGVSANLFKIAQNHGRERELFNVLANSPNLTHSNKRSIITSVLNQRIDNVADDVVSLFQSDAIISALEWMDSSGNNQLSMVWRNLLHAHTKTILKWLSETKKTRIDTILYLAGLLDPKSIRASDTSISVWVDFSKTAQSSNISKKDLVEFMSFILTIGFNNIDPEAALLIANSFQIIHDAAENNELPYQSWRWLENYAPSLSFWRDWDKCERLRAALVNAFIEKGWPVNHFLNAVKRQETLSQIIEYCKRSRQRMTFLEQVANNAMHGDESLRAEYISLLENIRR